MHSKKPTSASLLKPCSQSPPLFLSDNIEYSRGNAVSNPCPFWLQKLIQQSSSFSMPTTKYSSSPPSETPPVSSPPIHPSSPWLIALVGSGIVQATLCLSPLNKIFSIFPRQFAIFRSSTFTTSSGNCTNIVVERFNVFLDKGLWIFCLERDTTQCFVEGAQMFAYAWYSSPMVKIDTSRSLVAVGRELQF